MSVLEQEIPDGYKKTEIGVIPKSWHSLYLGDLAEIRMCKRVLSWQTNKSGPIPFFKIGTFGGQPDAFISNNLYNDFKKKFSFPQKGDVLISAAGTIGKTVVYDGENAYFQDSNIVWLEIDKTKILNDYLYHYYKVIKWASTEGSTISRLYNGIIKASPIALPPLKEQTAIANALSDVDALLTELEKLIAKKQAIKTATMQQLLTGKTRLPQFATYTEGEKLGQLKGQKNSELGEIPDDWDVQILKDISSMRGRIGWQGLKQEEFTFNDQQPFLITGMNFKDGKIRWNEVYHIPEDRYEMDRNIQLKVGDILMTKDGTIGKLLFVDHVPKPHKATLNSHLLLFRPKLESYVPKYLYYLMKTRLLDDHIELHKSGSTFFGITQEAMGKLLVLLPSNEEQTAIATILSDIDNEIQTLEQRLAKTRQIKQGMMQELLTGRTRLPFEKEN